MNLLDIFKLPECKEIKNLDSPLTAEIHRRIIKNNNFLKKLYVDFYKEFQKSIEDVPPGKLVELGSGSGFLKEVIPDVITSDVFKNDYFDMVFNATEIPLSDNSVSAFFMLNVLHHMNDPVKVFKEMNRCLVNGGKIVMIEPYNSSWGNLIRKFTFPLHKEGFSLGSEWVGAEVTSQNGRLSGANWMLGWTIFYKDRKKFERFFPTLKIKKTISHTPFAYVLSGGLSAKQFLPGSLYYFVRSLERLISPLNKYLAMFFTAELQKV